jgi:transcriptional regulator with XRE-family HTH domain
MTGPTVRSRQLGLGLKHLRNEAGITQRKAAETLECSQGKIGQIETARAPIRRAELIVLAQLYGADQVTIDQLDELRLMAGERGWWSTYGLPAWLASYVGLENDATAVRSMELELIPGLLQTEAYAREIHVLGGGGLSDDEVDARVAIRLRRQERLIAATNPLTLRTVVSQAALQRCLEPAGNVIGLAQMRHLQAQVQLPNVDLRILPFTAGRHPAMQGGFTILSFPPGILDDLAWQESATGGDIADDPVPLQALRTLHDQISAQALDREMSMAWLDENTH